MTQQAVTANLLDSGLVVFLAADGGWTAHIAEAATGSDDTECERLLETATKAVTDRVVVDPYLIEVADRDGSLWPVKRREWIRASGPTIAFAPGGSAETLRQVA